MICYDLERHQKVQLALKFLRVNMKNPNLTRHRLTSGIFFPKLFKQDVILEFKRNHCTIKTNRNSKE